VPAGFFVFFFFFFFFFVCFFFFFFFFCIFFFFLVLPPPARRVRVARPRGVAAAARVLVVDLKPVNVFLLELPRRSSVS